MSTELRVIGRTAKADFPANGSKSVPVKIDTGADTSSIWASNLHIDDDGYLHYQLFAVGSPYYTDKTYRTRRFTVRVVRSSHGTTQVRYSVRMSILLAGRRIMGTFSLADRSKNTYPVLIGCKLLNKKFIVDVSKGSSKPDILKAKTNALQDELQKDPRKFFEKYHASNQRGDIEL